MKVWVTRPSVWDCLVKGIDRCELWFSKPYFDRTPRGDSDVPLYRSLPRGWRALDADGLDVRGDMSLPVGGLLTSHPAIAEQLWSAVCESIEGTAGLSDKQRVERWESISSANTDTGDTSFLLELELPPDLWFQIALYNGFENGTWASRQYRYLLEADPDSGLLL